MTKNRAIKGNIKPTDNLTIPQDVSQVLQSQVANENKPKEWLQSITLSLLSTILFLVLIEFSFGVLYQKNYLKMQDSDHNILQNKYLASFSISKKDAKTLMFPIHKRSITNPQMGAIDINKLSFEFYEGDNITLAKTDLYKETAWYQLFLKESNKKHSLTDSIDNLFQVLATKVQKKKLIVAFGGSTTVFCVNWPFYLSKMLNEYYPDKFIVLNLGEPGFANFNYYQLLLAVMDKFKHYKLDPALILTLDGVNDYIIPLQFYALNSNNKKSQTLSDEVEGYIAMPFQLMPYTSMFIWRNIEQDKAAIPFTLDDNRNMMMTDEIKSNIINYFYSGQDNFTTLVDNKLKVPHKHFLQPIVTEKYHGLVTERLKYYADNIKTGVIYRPTIDYVFKVLGLLGYSADFYLQSDQIYQIFEQRYNEKENFYNLSRIFIDYNNFDKEVIDRDAIHYTTEGSEIIGRKIFDTLNQGTLKLMAQ